MASLEECRVAVADLTKNLSTADEGTRRDLSDRTLSLHVPDLDVTFSGRLAGGSLVDISENSADKAQIRFTIASDDLIALTRGELSFAPAWASGRIKIEASFRDLLRLRSFL